MLRRNISFVPETAKGVRDKNAFQAMLEYIDELGTADAETAVTYLRNLLFSFLVLRDKSRITLLRINRLSLEQYGFLLDSLLGTQSGGLLPLLVGVATFESIRETYGLPWTIDWQGINVADAASGAGGDITVSRDGRPIITIEVTERPIDRARVRATFNTKISPNRLDDYIFFYSGPEPSDDAREAARTYFAQGHDVNFLPLKDWTMTVMSALGQAGRRVFVDRMVALLEQKAPAGIKVVWNDAIRTIVS